MADDEVCEFSAEQILDQSSAYPLMADSECQMSTVILSAAYPELRYVKGTRRRIYAVSGAELQATEVVHWWNEKADETIIDSAFQPGPVAARNLPHVTLRYVESEISETERQEADRTIPRHVHDGGRCKVNQRWRGPPEDESGLDDRYPRGQ